MIILFESNKKQKKKLMNFYENEWDHIEQQWGALQLLKQYELAIQPDSIKDKKLIYMNTRDQKIYLDIVSNMPNVVEILTKELILSPGEKNYIKIRLKAPATLCKLIIRIGIVNQKKQSMNLEEGIEIRLTCNQ
ncbi:hypothetical protein pb186bvf_009276 [Paramecium bursaria]